MSAGHGVNFVSLIVEGSGLERFETIGSALVGAAAVFVLGSIALRQLRSSAVPVVPDASLTPRNLFEIVGETVLWLGDQVLGRENRRYLPFAATIFVYLMFLNLLGLVPGFSMPTDSVTFNLGVALVVFAMYNVWGIREVGIFAYLKHLWGPIFLLGPFLFVIELLGHFVRPLTLSLRLFGNMTGDHAAISTFVDLTKGGVAFWIPVIFYGLGTFVCIIQAFVFTVLTIVYIRLAVVHEHGAEADGHAH